MPVPYSRVAAGGRLRALRSALAPFLAPTATTTSSDDDSRPPALVAICGEDGGGGSAAARALVGWLCGGASGWCGDAVSDGGSTPGYPLAEVRGADEAVLVVTARDARLLLLDATSDATPPVVWAAAGGGVVVDSLTAGDVGGDAEVVEAAKIADFVAAVEACGRLAFPLPRHVPAAAAAEGWPLVQAYALDGVGPGGFLTRRHAVGGVWEALTPLLGAADAHTLKAALVDGLPPLGREWAAALRTARRAGTTLGDVVEPLAAYWEHGALQRAPPTAWLAGTTPGAVITPSTAADADTTGQAVAAAGPHLVLEGADGCYGLRLCRTCCLVEPPPPAAAALVATYAAALAALATPGGCPTPLNVGSLTAALTASAGGAATTVTVAAIDGTGLAQHDAAATSTMFYIRFAAGNVAVGDTVAIAPLHGDAPLPLLAPGVDISHGVAARFAAGASALFPRFLLGHAAAGAAAAAAGAGAGSTRRTAAVVTVITALGAPDYLPRIGAHAPPAWLAPAAAATEGGGDDGGDDSKSDASSGSFASDSDDDTDARGGATESKSDAAGGAAAATYDWQTALGRVIIPALREPTAAGAATYAPQSRMVGIGGRAAVAGTLGFYDGGVHVAAAGTAGITLLTPAVAVAAGRAHAAPPPHTYVLRMAAVLDRRAQLGALAIGGAAEFRAAGRAVLDADTEAEAAAWDAATQLGDDIEDVAWFTATAIDGGSVPPATLLHVFVGMRARGVGSSGGGGGGGGSDVDDDFRAGVLRLGAALEAPPPALLPTAAADDGWRAGATYLLTGGCPSVCAALDAWACRVAVDVSLLAAATGDGSSSSFPLATTAAGGSSGRRTAVLVVDVDGVLAAPVAAALAVHTGRRGVAGEGAGAGSADVIVLGDSALAPSAPRTTPLAAFVVVPPGTPLAAAFHRCAAAGVAVSGVVAALHAGGVVASDVLRRLDAGAAELLAQPAVAGVVLVSDATVPAAARSKAAAAARAAVVAAGFPSATVLSAQLPVAATAGLMPPVLAVGSGHTAALALPLHVAYSDAGAFMTAVRNRCATPRYAAGVAVGAHAVGDAGTCVVVSTATLLPPVCDRARLVEWLTAAVRDAAGEAAGLNALFEEAAAANAAPSAAGSSDGSGRWVRASTSDARDSEDGSAVLLRAPRGVWQTRHPLVSLRGVAMVATRDSNAVAPVLFWASSAAGGGGGGGGGVGCVRVLDVGGGAAGADGAVAAVTAAVGTTGAMVLVSTSAGASSTAMATHTEGVAGAVGVALPTPLSAAAVTAAVTHAAPVIVAAHGRDRLPRDVTYDGARHVSADTAVIITCHPGGDAIVAEHAAAYAAAVAFVNSGVEAAARVAGAGAGVAHSVWPTHEAAAALHDAWEAAVPPRPTSSGGGGGGGGAAAAAAAAAATDTDDGTPWEPLHPASELPHLPGPYTLCRGASGGDAAADGSAAPALAWWRLQPVLDAWLARVRGVLHM